MLTLIKNVLFLFVCFVNPRASSKDFACLYLLIKPPRPPPLTSRNGTRDAPPPPPPPPARMQSSSAQNSHESRGRPPPVISSSRQPSSHPPPPPPMRNGHTSASRAFTDEFESKYSFHPVEDLPPPEEYRQFAKIYPSKNNKANIRGAPPAPPVGR